VLQLHTFHCVEPLEISACESQGPGFKQPALGLCFKGCKATQACS